MVAFRSWYALAFPCVILLHLRVAPYTKVEESFNIQAIHDILQYGVPLSNAALKFKTLYDHMTFSGSVPRTFIGSLVVSFFAQPVGNWSGLHGLDLQVASRAVLGLITASALYTYGNAIKRKYGGSTAGFYLAMQCSQFHIFFYASRTLPNTFAFCLSTFALAAALTEPSSPSRVKRHRLSLYLLTLAAVIFRSEIVLLLGAQSLQLLLQAQGVAGRIALIRTILLPAIITGFMAGIVITVTIDTYFWQSADYLWPEGAAFLFNVFPSANQAGASAWGTSPWHWYFTSAIPRLLLNPALLLLPYGVFATPQRSAIFEQLFPALIYTIVYSILPHKETRFLFPIVPQFTLALALTASYISQRRQMIAKVITLLIIISTAAATIFSHAILLPLSAQTYPGGQALTLLHEYDFQHFSDRPQISVYLTNLALQTGITRFLEQPAQSHQDSSPAIQPASSPEPIIMPGSPDGRYPALTYYPKSTGLPTVKRGDSNMRPLWIYEKITPEQNQTVDFWAGFDYIIIETPMNLPDLKQSWDIVGQATSISRARPRLIRRDVSGGVSVSGSGAGAGAGQRNLLVLGEENSDGFTCGSINGVEDRLFSLLVAMYGPNMAWLYGAIHDIFVEGYGIGGLRLTRGYWIDWGLEDKLYILKRKQAVDSVVGGGGDDVGGSSGVQAKHETFFGSIA